LCDPLDTTIPIMLSFAFGLGRQMTTTIARREFIAALGGAAAWPLAARAQQQALPVVGVLDFGSESSSGLRWRVAIRTTFLRGLAEQGYVEGRNVAMLYRWGEYRTDRLPDLAADLVARKVSVIYAISAVAALVAKQATSTIPIVFGIGEDPVGTILSGASTAPGATSPASPSFPRN
jgi:putative ABC transport system substrate-binding protein